MDSSGHNWIIGNTFKQNADGGIYLYKNCWEHAGDPMQIPRTEGADHNLIENNRFIGERVGVWIAERADRDLSAFECGDSLIHESFGKRYYRDVARHNQVVANRFEDVETGVRVQDDDNTITGNVFERSDEGADIEIGSRVRLLVSDPVRNVRHTDNRFDGFGGVRYVSGER